MEWKRQRIALALALALAVPGSHPSAEAQVPGLLNYQGRVRTGSTPVDGIGQFKFALVNSDASQAYWQNSLDGNGDGEPDTAVSLPVSQGLFSVLLGDVAVANMAALPPSAFEHPAVFLRIWFNDGVSGFQRFVPDQRVAAVAYAMMAATVPDGSLGPEKLAPGTLNAANLTGTLDPARLPATIADQFAALTAQIDSLADQVRVLSEASGGGTVSVAGLTAVSLDAADAGLGALGFVPFSTIPAPGWRPGASADAPFPRYRHASVWTGTEWIIWGGALASGRYSPLGGIYEPNTDAWIPLSTDGAPTPRRGHVAVWTGEEMLVYGGENATGPLAGGGAYRPGTDRWRPLNLDGDPLARKDFTAAWTGDELLVFGGRNRAGQSLGNLQRLNPQPPWHFYRKP